MRRLIAGLFLLLASVASAAAGCGNSNPNCIVPNRPAGDSTNAAANTRFVTGALNGIPPTPTRSGDIIYWNGSIWTNLAGNNSGTKTLQETSSGVPSWGSTSLAAPTYQSFTSSSGTYTPTAGTTRIKVRMVGAGGGGGATITNNGTAGGTTSFGSWTAIGGGAGKAAQIATSTSGPAGGTGGVNGTGTLIVRFSGQNGGLPITTNSTTVQGGAGGNSVFGGAANQAGVNINGTAAAANTGSGGGGGATNGSNGGSGGGAGEYVEFTVASPSATSYTVGAKGTGGAAGTNAGGNGADGIILIEEFQY